MSKTATMWVAIVLVCAGVLAYAYSTRNESAMMQKDGDSAMKADAAAVQKDAMMKDETTQGDAMMKKDDAMMKDEGTKTGGAMMKDETSMMKKGSYEAYAPEKLALAANSDVVLFFHAAWCPICRALEKDIMAGQIPEGLTILKVDYDTATALKAKYGVTLQHTFVQVKADGTLVKKWSDATTLAGIKERVQ